MTRAWKPAVLGAAILLSGCGTELVPLAAFTASGLSYLSSGKGLTDHAISAAVHKDCSLLLIAQEGNLCKSGPELAEAPAMAMVGGGNGDAAQDRKIRELLDRADGWKTGDGGTAASPAATGAARPAAPAARGFVPFN